MEINDDRQYVIYFYSELVAQAEAFREEGEIVSLFTNAMMHIHTMGIADKAIGSARDYIEALVNDSAMVERVYEKWLKNATQLKIIPPDVGD